MHSKWTTFVMQVVLAVFHIMEEIIYW
jgi:hypothetical protein